MSATDITTFIGVAIALISSVLVPWILRRRQNADIASATDLASWQGIVATLKDERDDGKKEREELRAQLKAMEVEYKARLVAMEQECRDRMSVVEADYTAKLTRADARIAELEREVNDLYIRLGRRPQNPPG